MCRQPHLRETKKHELYASVLLEKGNNSKKVIHINFKYNVRRKTYIHYEPIEMVRDQIMLMFANKTTSKKQNNDLNQFFGEDKQLKENNKCDQFRW